eukprot:gb/GECG01005684.1/.p1 GENE.gb/GECG01005684.1/~~gb/GECG01005684.1/.p1  ORF type:complete len:134 (+),score=0.97 gb/GECG01005684.1/:1-402(+)
MLSAQAEIHTISHSLWVWFVLSSFLDALLRRKGTGGTIPVPSSYDSRLPEARLRDCIKQELSNPSERPSQYPTNSIFTHLYLIWLQVTYVRCRVPQEGCALASTVCPRAIVDVGHRPLHHLHTIRFHPFLYEI